MSTSSALSTISTSSSISTISTSSEAATYITTTSFKAKLTTEILTTTTEQTAIEITIPVIILIGVLMVCITVLGTVAFILLIRNSTRHNTDNKVTTTTAPDASYTERESLTEHSYYYPRITDEVRQQIMEDNKNYYEIC